MQQPGKNHFRTPPESKTWKYSTKQYFPYLGTGVSFKATNPVLTGGVNAYNARHSQIPPVKRDTTLEGLAGQTGRLVTQKAC